ncbi:MAG: hypothetical protein Q7J07_08465 [Pelolinea sp.]|nr:hypothetical protein [Pelolinea sp.]
MDAWQRDLDTYFAKQKKTKKEIKTKQANLKKDIKHFMQGEVLPAFEALKKEFKKHKREITIESKKDWAVVLVKRNSHKEFVYEVNISADAGDLAACKRVYTINKKGKLKLRVEGKISNPGNSPLLISIKKDDIIKDFLEHYKDTTRAR